MNSVTVLVKVNAAFSNKFSADKQGHMPVILTALKGSLPEDSNVMNGTIAASIGLKPGDIATLIITYLDTVTVKGNEYHNYRYELDIIMTDQYREIRASQVLATLEAQEFGVLVLPTKSKSNSAPETETDSEA